MIHALIILVGSFGFTSQVFARSASADEVRRLFDLAIIRPDRSRFVADLEWVEPPGSAEQIAIALRRQNELMKGRDGRLSAKQREDLITARSNAIAASMSGKRIQHVEEWYSGQHSRLDRSDAALLVSSTYSNWVRSNPTLFHETYVRVNDPVLSPYLRFHVNHQLRDVTVTRNTDLPDQEPNNLWRVLGLDQPLAIPILLAFVDFKTLDASAIRSSTSPDSDLLLRNLKPDSKAIDRIVKGSDPNWRLEASEDTIDNVSVIRFILEGKYPAPEMPLPLSSIQVSYWIRQIANRTVCVQAVLTNHTHNSSFCSKKEQFDNNGLPRVWRTTTTKDGSAMQFNVYFKEIDVNPVFSDAEIFSPHFAASYTVSDITSGTAVLLSKAVTVAKVNPSDIAQAKAPPLTLTRIVLGTLLLIPLGLLIFKVLSKRSLKLG